MKLLGGNSAFAHLGRYTEESNGEIAAEIITQRRNDDPHCIPPRMCEPAGWRECAPDGDRRKRCDRIKTLSLLRLPR